MSLLEEALRRHDELAQRQTEAPGSPPPRDQPVTVPPPPSAAPPRSPAPRPRRATTPSCPEHALPTPPVPLLARVVAVVVPLLILLLFVGLAWLMLRTNRPGRGGGPQPPRDTAPEYRPEAPTAPAAIPRIAETTNHASMPFPVDVLPPVPMSPPVPRQPVAPTGTTTTAAAETPRAIEVPSARDVVPPWPLVAVKGIASGRERLVVLDTGEMLSAGERSRTGVRVVRIGTDCAWIEWHGATNMLRKGEDSSKPLQE